MRKITFNPKNFIIELAKNQIQPALGCTEIGIVALAAAKAASLLPNKFSSAIVKVSTSIYRNDARVGVPKFGVCGISTIAAIGFVLKNPEKKLQCVSDVDKKTIPQIISLGKSKKIVVNISYNAPAVFTHVIAKDVKKNVAEVTILNEHSDIVSAKLNGKETIKDRSKSKTRASCGLNFDEHADDLPLQTVYNICKKFTLKELEFLQKAMKINEEISAFGLKKCTKSWITQSLLTAWKKDKKSIFDKITLKVCAAVEARMLGCNLPVATAANSGDHGLCVSIPLTTYAEYAKCSNLKTLQAYIFAHYITWTIKSHIGHLCGMCGSAVAAVPGAICGLGFLMNWNWTQINDLLNAMLCSQANILCDGAKLSCAYKCISGLQNGYLALKIIVHKGKIADYDGIVHKNVNATLRNYRYLSEKTHAETIHTTVALLDHMQKNIEKK